MSRTVRLLLIVVGLGAIVGLTWALGLRLVLGMMARAAWSVPAIALVYLVHIGIRALALWRTMLVNPVRYTDVLRIRLAGEAVEVLTFTGPFLAEPAKGWLLKARGLSTAAAFASVVAEYLLYTVVSACLALVAVALLLTQGTLPPAARTAAVLVGGATIAFIGAFVFAAVTGIGLLVPIVRASGHLIGRARIERAAHELEQVERVLLVFLHAHPARLVEVLAIEAAAHLLLIAEVVIVLAALGLSVPWTVPVIVEGGVKFVAIVFAPIPGQVGASEGTYALLFAATGLPTAAGLTLALVRRLRALLAAGLGVVALAFLDGRHQPSA